MKVSNQQSSHGSCRWLILWSTCDTSCMFHNKSIDRHLAQVKPSSFVYTWRTREDRRPQRLTSSPPTWLTPRHARQIPQRGEEGEEGEHAGRRNWKNDGRKKRGEIKTRKKKVIMQQKTCRQQMYPSTFTALLLFYPSIFITICFVILSVYRWNVRILTFKY